MFGVSWVESLDYGQPEFYGFFRFGWGFWALGIGHALGYVKSLILLASVRFFKRSVLVTLDVVVKANVCFGG